MIDWLSIYKIWLSLNCFTKCKCVCSIELLYFVTHIPDGIYTPTSKVICYKTWTKSAEVIVIIQNNRTLAFLCKGGLLFFSHWFGLNLLLRTCRPPSLSAFFKININVLCEWIFNHTISQGNVLTYYRRHVLLKFWSVIFLLLSDVLRLYSHNAASTNDTSKRTMMIEIIEITSAELADEALSKKQSGLISTGDTNRVSLQKLWLRLVHLIPMCSK